MSKVTVIGSNRYNNKIANQVNETFATQTTLEELYIFLNNNENIKVIDSYDKILKKLESKEEVIIRIKNSNLTNKRLISNLIKEISDFFSKKGIKLIIKFIKNLIIFKITAITFNAVISVPISFLLILLGVENKLNYKLILDLICNLINIIVEVAYDATGSNLCLKLMLESFLGSYLAINYSTFRRNTIEKFKSNFKFKSIDNCIDIKIFDFNMSII